MKFFCKKFIWLGLAFLALTSCESADLPHVFGDNEVPTAVKNQPRAVAAVPPNAIKDMNWQRLGDVPNAPKDFTSQPLIDQTVQQMHQDRDEALRIQQRTELPPPEFSQ